MSAYGNSLDEQAERDLARLDALRGRDHAGMHGPPGPPRYKLLTGADVASLPAMQWRVKGVLPVRGIAQIYGGSTAGKSFLAFDMAAAVAEGRDWFGYRVRQAPVTYVALEGQGGFAQRIRAWEMEHDRMLPDALRIVLQPFRISDHAQIASLGGAIEHTLAPGCVVVIDTQNASVPLADENSSAEMGAIIEGAKLLAEQTQRSARARARAAAAWDEKAEKELGDASDTLALAKARERAQHYRWRASKINPKEYGEFQKIEHAGRIGIEQLVTASLQKPDAG